MFLMVATSTTIISSTRNLFSTYDISTAINIALRLTRLGQFMPIIEAISKQKVNEFFDGTKCKNLFHPILVIILKNGG